MFLYLAGVGVCDKMIGTRGWVPAGRPDSYWPFTELFRIGESRKHAEYLEI